MYKINTNILLIILSTILLFFTSCVNNSDAPDPVVPIDDQPVGLSMETIEGKWEVYYSYKTIDAPSINVQSTKYRVTDEEGFSVTFLPDGKFYEQNVFDMKTKKDGTYTLEKGENSDKIDHILFKYYDEDLKKDSVFAAFIPYVYDNRFVFDFDYHGTSGGINYNVTDLKYYRHTQRAPNYQSPQLPAKVLVDEQKLLGLWSVFSYREKINGTWYEDSEQIGTQFYFWIDNGVRKYREIPPSQEYALEGYYRIVDDVIHMYRPVRNPETGEVKNESSKMWVQEWSTTGGIDMIIDGDKYRKDDDVREEKEIRAHYKKIE